MVFAKMEQQAYFSKLDDTSLKKNVYMRVMLHKTGRRASLPVMNLATFDAAFTSYE